MYVQSLENWTHELSSLIFLVLSKVHPDRRVVLAALLTRQIVAPTNRSCSLSRTRSLFLPDRARRAVQLSNGQFPSNEFRIRPLPSFLPSVESRSESYSRTDTQTQFVKKTGSRALSNYRRFDTGTRQTINSLLMRFYT